MADSPHAVALLGLLKASANLTVYDEQVPDSPVSAYVRPYVYGLALPGDDLTMGSTEDMAWITCHCAAETAEGARIVARNVRAVLLDATPVVPGWVCWPIRMSVSLPPSRDESTGRMVMDQVDTYGFLSKIA